MTRTTPKALIVDFGGVLTTSVFDSFQSFCEDTGVAPEALKQALVAAMDGAVIGDADHPLAALETGTMSLDDFNHYLSEALSKGLDAPLDPSGLRDRLFGGLRADARMFHAVKKVKDAGFSTALLSNSWGPGGYPTQVFDEMFDVVIISGEVGLRKPQPEIYLLASDKLGLQPQECVFVDDLKTNIRGAEAVGMTGLHHKDTDETLKTLDELFG